MMSEWAVWEKQNKKKRKQKTDLKLVGSFLSRLSLWEAERLCIVKRLKADLLFFLSLSLSLFLSAKIIRSGFDLLAPLIHLFPALISLHFFSLSLSLFLSFSVFFAHFVMLSLLPPNSTTHLTSPLHGQWPSVTGLPPWDFFFFLNF